MLLNYDEFEDDDELDWDEDITLDRKLISLCVNVCSHYASEGIYKCENDLPILGITDLYYKNDTEQMLLEIGDILKDIAPNRLQRSISDSLNSRRERNNKRAFD